ncbi:MAG: hypothetical protein Q9216_006172 [Gyalolechia sp. 2 TL-2023]
MMDACSVSYSHLQEIVRKGVFDALLQYQWQPPIVTQPPHNHEFVPFLDSQSPSGLTIHRQDLELLHGPCAEINQSETGIDYSLRTQDSEQTRPSKNDAVKREEDACASTSLSHQPAISDHSHARSNSEHQVTEHSRRNPSPTPSIEIVRTKKFPTAGRARKKRKRALRSKAPTTIKPDPAQPTVGTPFKCENLPTTTTKTPRKEDQIGKPTTTTHRSFADAPPLSASQQSSSTPQSKKNRPTAADFFPSRPSTPESGEILPEPPAAVVYSDVDIERLIEEEKLAAAALKYGARVYLSRTPPPPIVSTDMDLSCYGSHAAAAASHALPSVTGNGNGVLQEEEEDDPSRNCSRAGDGRAFSSSSAVVDAGEIIPVEPSHTHHPHDQRVEASLLLRTEAMKKRRRRWREEEEDDCYRLRYGVMKDRRR